MGFHPISIWDMGYKRFMGFRPTFPAYQNGIHKILWVIGGYGLLGV
jgi:hypothetical protein